VHKAVVTVPAYFNDNQRQATKDAGAIAGLEVIRIINEPTAAALAYGFGRNIDRTVAVYDLGGGTFDVSILEIGSTGVFKVISTAGDTFLGGEDFDARVIDWLVEGFRDRARHRPAQGPHGPAAPEGRRGEGQDRAVVGARGGDQPPVHHLVGSQRGPCTCSGCSPARLRAPHRRPRERTVEIVQQTLDDAGLHRDDVEDVILVGGMTRMPLVQRASRSFFGREPSKGVHPDEVVAIGAAIQGAALIEDVAPRPIGWCCST
jgi:molecular chaperone DnaK